MSASSASSSVLDPPSPQTSTEAESVTFRRGVTESHTNSPSAHSLAWYSTIEYLADSNTDLPLLKELINRAPNFYTEAPEQVQERVALRYLEDLASRGMVAGTPDISQSAVEFLCQSVTTPIDPCQLSESRIAPVSDNIRQFISQKRSALPTPLIDLV